MKKSKVDRLIKKFQAEARQQAQAEMRKRVMDELTFLVHPPEGAFELNRIERPYVRIVMSRRNPVQLEDYLRGDFSRYELKTPPVANFAATRKSWTSGEGHTVCWYDWEFKGVSF